jgi:D-xylonolactonase
MEELASGFSLLEGPTVDPESGLYFSDVLAGGVYRWSPDGVEQVVPKRRGVGGIVLHEDGGVIVTGRDVLHVRDGGSRTLLSLEGATGFNDLATAPDGSVYVGALRFHPFAGDAPVPGEIWRSQRRATRSRSRAASCGRTGSASLRTARRRTAPTTRAAACSLGIWARKGR